MRNAGLPGAVALRAPHAWQAFDRGEDRMSASKLLVVATGALGLVATVLAADPRTEGWSFGGAQYQARCAACHGARGKGDGTAAKQAKLTVPDLTTYARRNGGAFPTELAWQKIDGRPVAWDSKSQMPVWGHTFRHEATGAPFYSKDAETYVAAEIRAILEYVKTLQVK
jgi:mono/diheme cytochrome c family protein